MNSRKLKGFTLVELLVAMAIFAVLVALAIGGVSLAQRASRDAQRRDTLKTINLNLADLYSSTADFPSAISANTTGTTLSATVGAITKDVTVAGSSRALVSTATASTVNGTRYCYSKTSTGYTIAALMEDGIWDYSLSTTTPKPANSTTLSGCTPVAGSTLTQ